MGLNKITFFLIVTYFLITGCQNFQTENPKNNIPMNQSTNNMIENNVLDTAYFGAGCFWCVEAIFQNINGVIEVVSGYMGGDIKNPSYREICTGNTGHAEICKITFDTTQISYSELLEIFWTTHDPTTLNRQGADRGTQYRSVIFYTNDTQKELAMQSKQNVAPTLWDQAIVTEITPSSIFYPAEDHHQNYYNENTEAYYCQLVINPKLNKLKEKFNSKLKTH